MSLTKVELSINNILKVLLLSIASVIVLHYGSLLILPMIIAVLFTVILLAPVEKFLKWGLPEWLSVSLSLVLFFLLLAAVSIVITWQVNDIASEWPTIQEKSSERYQQVEQWSEQTFGFNVFQYFSTEGTLVRELKSYLTVLATSFTTAISQIFITMVYLIFFLMQRKMFVKFLYKIIPEKSHAALTIILKQSRETVSKYIFGKGIIILILFVTYFIGFLIGNVPHAIFLAMFAALFSIIPYIGNLLGGGAAMLLATAYSGFVGGFIVFGVVSVAQVIESYILTPIIIGDQIDLNPFITIFGVVAFTLLWGVTGAVISLPILGIIKVLTSQIKGLENFHFLLEKEKKDK